MWLFASKRAMDPNLSMESSVGINYKSTPVGGFCLTSRYHLFSGSSTYSPMNLEHALAHLWWVSSHLLMYIPALVLWFSSHTEAQSKKRNPTPLHRSSPSAVGSWVLPALSHWCRLVAQLRCVWKPHHASYTLGVVRPSVCCCHISPSPAPPSRDGADTLEKTQR